MNEKVKELVAIGASVGAHCQPCLAHHIAKAKDIGLEEGEIREAIAVGHMVEKGAVSAMRQFSADIFKTPSEKEHKNCANGTSKGGGCCG